MVGQSYFFLKGWVGWGLEILHMDGKGVGMELDTFPAISAPVFNYMYNVYE